MKKLNELDLVAIIKAHRQNSFGPDGGELVQERAAAMDHYHGRPYGDEIEGQSQVVSRDLAEAVDWVVPAIIRTYVASGNVVEFLPVGPEDEEGAEQETDYINHLIMQKNDGFLVIHDCVKDALILKNCYIKHWYEEAEKVREVPYQGLTGDQLAMMLFNLQAEGAEVEILEQDETASPIGVLYDVKLQIKRKKGQIHLAATPPEQLRISKRCTGSLQDSPFTEHETVKTRSELLEMGMDKEFVNELEPSSSGEGREESSRNSVSDESDSQGGTIDRSMDEMTYCEAYLKVDYDGDGIAELRKVVTVNNKIPPGGEWNEVVDCVPFSGGVPKRMPHKHIGESLDDDLGELQHVKTVLTRQMLTNIYNTNNQQWIVNDRVDEESFLKSVPGGLKFVDGEADVGGAVMPVPTTPILNQILPAIDYIDSVKENRTGISKSMTQMDPDILKNSTKGAFLESLNMASQKVEMITRMLAETLLKELALRVHELALKHQDIMTRVKLNGKWVEIDPRQWKERTDLRVKVGLGYGSGEDKMRKLTLLAGLQEKLAQAGLVGAEEAYAMFVDIAQAIGAETPEKYIKSPDQIQPQQPQPNPLAEAEQIKGQFKLQAQQMDIQYKAQVEQMKRQFEHEKTLIEARAKAEMEVLKQGIQSQENARDRLSKEAIEAAKLEVQAFIEGLRIDLGKQGMGTGLQDGN